MNMNTNPLIGILRTLGLFLSGRIRFDKELVGSTITMGDGVSFTIFRRARIQGPGDPAQVPEAMFIVRFTPMMDTARNIRLSRLLLVIFMGFRGFRSKYWCVNEESGMCQGVYEWDTLEDAENYSKSIAVTNMTRRSQPGTVSFQVLPNTPENRTWVIARDAQRSAAFKRAYGL